MIAVLWEVSSGKTIRNVIRALSRSERAVVTCGADQRAWDMTALSMLLMRVE